MLFVACQSFAYIDGEKEQKEEERSSVYGCAGTDTNSHAFDSNYPRKKLVSEFTDRLPSNNTKQSNWSSWIFDSILNPTQQLFSSRSQEKITPPKFNPYERVVIGPNDVVPSLAGTLGYVADPEQRPPRPGHAAVCVYAVDVPIYLPEEALAKPGSIISSPEGPLAGLSNLQFGDVVLIHGLKTEDRSWINHVEGVVSVVAHGVPSRYGVDIPDKNGDLKRYFF